MLFAIMFVALTATSAVLLLRIGDLKHENAVIGAAAEAAREERDAAERTSESAEQRLSEAQDVIAQRPEEHHLVFRVHGNTSICPDYNDILILEPGNWRSEGGAPGDTLGVFSTGRDSGTVGAPCTLRAEATNVQDAPFYLFYMPNRRTGWTLTRDELDEHSWVFDVSLS